MVSKLDRLIDGSLPGRLYAALIAALAPAPEPDGRVDGTDRVLALVLGASAALVAWRVMALVPVGLYGMTGFDIWFQADQPRALGALTERLSVMHYRDNVHPLFSLLLFPLAALLRVAGLSPLASGQGVMLLCAFGSTALLYLVLRRMRLGRLTGVLGAAGFVASAAFLNWFGIVETYATSSLFAIAAVYLFTRRPVVTPLVTVLASALTLSGVITDWTLGVALTATRWSLSRFLRYSLTTLVLCVALSAVQHRIFPHAGEFYHRYAIQGEEAYIGDSELQGTHTGPERWLARVRGVVITAAVAPQPYFEKLAGSGKTVMNNQYAPLASYGAWGLAAVASWLALLALSALTLIAERRITPTILAIGGFLLGQMVLHLFYGDITFLYAGDFFVVLMVLACQGGRGRWQGLHAAVLACFVLCAAVANSHVLRQTTTMAAQAAAMAAKANGKTALPGRPD